MNQISDIMSKDVRIVAPNDSLQKAAQMMDELNVGAIPVCEGEQLVGIITDRDITVRGVAYGKSAGSTPVEEVMSTDVHWCYEDQQIEEVNEKMSDVQVRRIPVVDRQQHLVGIVSLGDLAAKHSEQDAGETLRDISSPSEPNRSGIAGTMASAGAQSQSQRSSRSQV